MSWLPNVDAELALLLVRSTLEKEKFDLMESLLSSVSEAAEVEPSEVFLFTEGKEFLILSNKDKFSSGSISITSLGGMKDVSVRDKKFP